MSLGGYTPYLALSYFNGYLYGDSQARTSIVVASKTTGASVTQYNTVCLNHIYSITFDSFGYMAVSCFNGGDGPIALYNAYNGTYLNLQLSTSSYYPLATAVDASGRFVSMSVSAIDIYY